MDKTQEYRQARLALQLGMVKDGKAPWEIRKALKEFDRTAEDKLTQATPGNRSAGSARTTHAGT
jgi:hypothetical protein